MEYRVIKANQAKEQTLVEIQIKEDNLILIDKKYQMPEFGHLYVIGDLVLRVKSVSYTSLKKVTLYCDKFKGIRGIKGKNAKFYGRFAKIE